MINAQFMRECCDNGNYSTRLNVGENFRVAYNVLIIEVKILHKLIHTTCISPAAISFGYIFLSGFAKVVIDAYPLKIYLACEWTTYYVSIFIKCC